MEINIIKLIVEIKYFNIVKEKIKLNVEVWKLNMNYFVNYFFWN